MIPHPLALLWLWIWLATAGVAALVPDWTWLWQLGGGVLAGLALCDGLWLRSIGPFEVERALAQSLALGVWSGVKLHIRNLGRRRARLQVYDHAPSSMELRSLPHALELYGDQEAQVAYGVRPNERGAFRFQAAELVLHSPLRFWRRRLRVGPESALRVYPNFRELMKYSLLATDHRTSQLGIQKRQRRGEGLDFHQLREYRAGDALRQIDWKVTARMRKTISREYQDERDQQVLFLLDCGHKMRAKDDGLSHFDQALNALLLLSHVCLKQGDAVGLLTFSGEHRWLAPRKGNGQLNPLLNAVYDLRAGGHASDYLGAAQELIRRVQKRALVVIVSNLRDEDHAELRAAAHLLGHSHLVLVASMKERVLSAALEAPVRDLDDAVRVAATHRYLQSRRRAHDTLTHEGVLALDADPEQLAVALVNGYLDIKSRGLL